MASVLGLLLSLACGRQVAPESVPQRSLVAPIASLIEASRPARFVYHPLKAAKTTKRGRLQGDEELAVGERGERWLFRGSSEPPASANQLAPEALVDFARAQDAWVFAGESGALYQSATPLGTFESVRVPSVRLARVGLADAGAVGVSRRGELYAAPGLEPWRRAPAGRKGPGQPFFFAVAMNDAGEALALASPESFWFSDDRGARYRELSTPAFGASGVVRQADQLVVRGAGAVRRVDHGRLVEFVPQPEPSRGRSGEGSQSFSPRAGALEAGSAVVYRDAQGDLKYLEVRVDGGKATLLSGRSGASLHTQPLAERCARYVVTAMANRWWLLCAEADSEHSRIRVTYTDDGGAHWAEPQAYWGDARRLRAAAVASDTQLVMGLCRESGAGAACEARGLHRVVGGKLEYVPFAAARSTMIGLDASPDGRRVALLVLEEGGGTRMFVSDDSGRTLVAGPRTTLSLSRPASASWLRGAFRGLSVDDAGYGTVVYRGPGRRGLQVLGYEPDGRQVTDIFVPALAVAGHGRRVVALVEPEDAGPRLIFSEDSGRHFPESAPVPSWLCSGEGAESCALACHAGGCELGSQFSMVGWRLRDMKELPLFEQTLPSPVPPLEEPSLASPVACQFADGSEWVRASLVRPPKPSEIAIGSLDWFAVETQDRAANLVTHEAAGGRVERVQLFAPRRGQEFAIHASYQVEGVAALRRGAGQEDEVAFRNYLYPPKGPLPSLLVPSESARGVSRDAGPMLSIADDGLFVAPAEVFGEPIFFVGPTTKAAPVWRWPPAQVKGAVFDLARIEGRTVAFGIAEGGSVVMRVDAPGRTPLAQTIGIPDAESFALVQRNSLTYVDNALGVHLQWQGDGAPQPVVFPAAVDGPAAGAGVRVPRQSDAQGALTPCEGATVTTTPRVVAMAERTYRHPVVVVDIGEEHPPLVTAEAVMYGTPAAPCVAAFAATGLRQSRYSAVISVHAPRGSWLFRPSADGKATELRPMTCAEDPMLPLPKDFDPLARSPRREGGAGP